MLGGGAKTTGGRPCLRTDTLALSRRSYSCVRLWLGASFEGLSEVDRSRPREDLGKGTPILRVLGWKALDSGRTAVCWGLCSSQGGGAGSALTFLRRAVVSELGFLSQPDVFPPGCDALGALGL